MTQSTTKTALAAVLAASMFTACATRQPGQVPQPGFNSYSPQQDIEIGRQAAMEIDGEVPIVQNAQLQNYVSSLGRALAARPEAGEYPYSFKMINDPSINAFALPGGPIYVNSGILTNAENEGEVAGVLAHEISHVALRHGTNQASKAQLFDVLGQLGAAALPDRGVVGQLGQLGLGLGVATVLLRYSRTAESEADALGTRIMAGSGYDPVRMASFFQKLEEQAPRSGTAEFLSSHPNPGNRVRAVNAEIPFIEARPYNASTGDFGAMKQAAQRLPEPPKPRGQ
jgi:predicted Zn-dependent protease